MSTRLLTFKDKIITKETPHAGGFKGHIIFGRGRHIVKYTDPFGNPAYRSEFDEVIDEGDNIVTIGGYQFAFSKLFNIGLDQESTLRVGDLNDEAPQMKIGVPKADYISNLYNAEQSTIGTAPVRAGINISANNFIFGFMMGDGGAREDNVTAIAPDYKNRGLFHPVPFRISNDGYAIPSNKYYGKSTTLAGSTGMQSITSLYVKKFDDPAPHIVHCWANEKDGELDIVDDSVFSSTSSVAIESYVEMNISISQYDGRGYSIATNTTPRMNEIALVSGWYNPQKDDYECMKIFTHFTRPSIMLTEGDSIEAIYRLYAR